MFELRERGVLPIEPLPDARPYIDIRKWFLTGLGILSGKLCGVRQQGTPHVGASDDVFFGVNLAGCSTARQRGRETSIGDGDGILLSCAETSFSLASPTPVHFLGLRVARKQLAPLVPRLDDRLMRVTPRCSEALNLLTGYVRTAINDQTILSPQIEQVVANHLLDLIALSLCETRLALLGADTSVRAARLQAIKHDITANLYDGSLTVVVIAARHGITPRYVQKLFEGEGTTFAQYVLEHRLDRAYRMLRDQRFATRSITSVAYDAGFGDLSYFNRAFRRRYRATPSDVRNSMALSNP